MHRHKIMNDSARHAITYYTQFDTTNMRLISVYSLLKGHAKYVLKEIYLYTSLSLTTLLCPLYRPMNSYANSLRQSSPRQPPVSYSLTSAISQSTCTSTKFPCLSLPTTLLFKGLVINYRGGAATKRENRRSETFCAPLSLQDSVKLFAPPPPF